MSTRRRVAALGAIGFGLVALFVSYLANAEFERGVAISERNPMTQAAYPWVVWTDLLVFLALGLAVAMVAWLCGEADSSAGASAFGLVIAAALGAVAWVLLEPSTGIALVVLYLGVMWAGPRLIGKADSGTLVLLSVAFLVRASLAVALSRYGLVTQNQIAIFDDEVAYHNAAGNVARVLLAGFGDLDMDWRHMPSHYLDVLGLLYVLLGSNFALARLFNAALGTLVVALVVGIGRGVTRNERVALGAGWLTALWPMVVFWSASGLRESTALFTALLVPWLLTRGVERLGALGWALGLLTAVLGLVILAPLRPELVVAVVLALLVAGLAGRRAARVVRTRRMLVAVAGVAIVGLLAALVASQNEVLRSRLPTPRGLEFRLAVVELTPFIERVPDRLPPAPDASFLPLGTIVRVPRPDGPGLATGITSWYQQNPPAYHVRLSEAQEIILPRDGVQPLTDENIGWADVAGRVIDGLRLTFVPLVGVNEPLRRLAIAPDTVLWDVLVVVSLVAVWRERHRLGSLGVLLLMVPLGILLVLGPGASNLGTVARQRSTLVPWLALLAAPLLVQVWLPALARPGKQPHDERRGEDGEPGYEHRAMADRGAKVR